MFSASCVYPFVTQRKLIHILILCTVLFVVVCLGFNFFSLSSSIAPSQYVDKELSSVGVVEKNKVTAPPSISPPLTAINVDHASEFAESDVGDVVEISFTDFLDFQQFVVSAFLDPRNYFCDLIESTVAEFHLNHTNLSLLPRVHVTIEVSCLDVFFKSGWGTGNYVLTTLMMRLVLRYMSIARVKLNITCTDTEEVQMLLVLPWYTGVWYSSNYFDFTDSFPMPNFENMQGPFLQPPLQNMPPIDNYRLCGPAWQHPTEMMYEELTYAARRMAVALVGVSLVGTDYLQSTKIDKFMDQYIYYNGSDNVPINSAINATVNFVKLSPGNQHERITETMKLVPSIPFETQVEIDDVALHFRCGDILNVGAGYGFMSFPGYSRHVSSDVRTIGILTQPFCIDPNAAENSSDSSSFVWHRRQDMDHCERCQVLTLAFVQYLVEHFPNATVTVRNDPSEPLSLVQSRMVLANQTVGTLSSFSIFPILASFGRGFVMNSGTAHIWAAVNSDNFELFDEPNILPGNNVTDLWNSQGEDAVIHWFRTGILSNAINFTEA